MNTIYTVKTKGFKTEVEETSFFVRNNTICSFKFEVPTSSVNEVIDCENEFCVYTFDKVGLPSLRRSLLNLKKKSLKPKV